MINYKLANDKIRLVLIPIVILYCIEDPPQNFYALQITTFTVPETFEIPNSVCNVTGTSV